MGNKWFSFIWEEDPLKLWRQCKEAFVMPEIITRKISPDDTTAKIFDFRVSGLGWKSKFGNYEFEYPPFIDICLFNKWRWQFVFEAPQLNNTNELCYWEGMMDWLWNNDKDIIKTYEDNIWNNNCKEETIVPYLTIKAYIKLINSGKLYKNVES